MDTFEYLVEENLGDTDLQTQLNTAGTSGWELVSILPNPNSSATVQLVFKRLVVIP